MNKLKLTKVLSVLVIMAAIASVWRIGQSARAEWALDSNGVAIVSYMRQCDSKWGGLANGNSTICQSGSGRTALAMILNYYGMQKTPADITGSAWADYAGQAGLAVSTNIAWDKIEWLLSNSRPVIINVGKSIFTNTAEHYIVVRGISNGTAYVNDPRHPLLTSTKVTILKNAFLAGNQYSLYARPSGYDPCGWDGIVCPDSNTPSPTPSVTVTPSTNVTPTDSITPTPSIVTLVKPTISLDASTVSTTNVTLKAKATDPNSDKVRLHFRIRRNESSLTATQKCQTVQDSYFSATSTKWSDLITSGTIKSYVFSNLEPGQYAWSARAVDANNNYSDGSGEKFCYENGIGSDAAYGWATAKTFTVAATAVVTPTPEPANNAPVINLVKEVKSGNSVTVYAKATDVDNDQVSYQFRIRRNEEGWTVEQKCDATSSVIDSLYSSNPVRVVWSDLKTAGQEYSYTFSGLNSGNYLWSARAKDSHGVQSLGSGERFCFEEGLGSAEAYGWQTARSIIIP